MMEMHNIPAGCKLTDIGLMPSDWDSVSISELITDLRGGAPFKPSDFTKNGIKVLPKGGVIRGGLLRILEKDQQFCSPSFASKYSKNQVNERYTIVVLRDLVPSGPSIGLMVKIPDSENYVLAQGVYGFLTKNESVSAYLIQYSNTNKYRRAANEIMVGSTQVHITNGAFKELKIALPSCEKEQTAIANALSDVDALIQELEKLITKKQAIKTATMQQLITGRTRLPQFAYRADGSKKGTKQSELGQIPEDWGCVTLGDIGQTIIGLTYSPDNVSDYGVLVLRSSNVQNGQLAYRDNVYVSMDLPDRVMVRKGDILICVRNGSRQLIGKCALIDDSAVGHAFGAFMSIYRTDAYKFVFYQFQSDIIQNQINEMMGATINQITNKDMSRFQISMPPTVEEQTAISETLSDIDKEIQALEQRLSKTRKIKQGMMQELLTGKTRLVKPESA